MSLLLDLPDELRYLIYYFLFSGQRFTLLPSERIEANLKFEVNIHEDNNRPQECPAVFLVSRSVRTDPCLQEAFVRASTFVLSTSSDVRRLSTALNEKRRNQLAHICIRDISSLGADYLRKIWTSFVGLNLLDVHGFGLGRGIQLMRGGNFFSLTNDLQAPDKTKILQRFCPAWQKDIVDALHEVATETEIRVILHGYILSYVSTEGVVDGEWGYPMIIDLEDSILRINREGQLREIQQRLFDD